MPLKGDVDNFFFSCFGKYMKYWNFPPKSVKLK